ncbi:hypothetical protein NDU88_006316 [Pleurodeles waltl]|uniref:Uncharacterized protein n=1 Tax=Pleurodeles waltl TaxID=8319 RepID=A0AAV7RPR7_PLEWA|nr:hypothetical protein NDU88_006316 [Pleurodeles waltl]
MVLGAQDDPTWHQYTPSRPLRSLIKRAISDVLTAAAGVIGLIRLVSYALKNNMAPKAIRNLGDKTEGAKTTRVGRDKGESAGVNKRLTSIVEIEDSNRETRENKLGPPAGGKQLQIRHDQIEQPERQNGEGTVNTSGPSGPAAGEGGGST